LARASKGPNRARRKQGERTECRRRGAVAASASAAVAAAGCRVGVCRHVHKRGEAQLHRHQRRTGHAIEPDRLKHEPHRTQRQDGRWQPVCVDLPRRVERRPLDGRHVERHVAARHERSGGDPRLDAPGSRHTQRERCTCRRRWWDGRCEIWPWAAPRRLPQSRILPRTLPFFWVFVFFFEKSCSSRGGHRLARGHTLLV